jgi:hypothetical protein
MRSSSRSLQQQRVTYQSLEQAIIPKAMVSHPVEAVRGNKLHGTPLGYMLEAQHASSLGDARAAGCDSDSE